MMKVCDTVCPEKKQAFLNDFRLPWDKVVGLTSDGAPVMCGHKSGLVVQIWEKMKEEHVTGELTAYHYHSPRIVVWQSLENGACDEHHNTSSQLHQSQRFKSRPILLFWRS